MVWYGMVNVDLYSAIITKVSNALDTLVSGEKKKCKGRGSRLDISLPVSAMHFCTWLDIQHGVFY